ncbi:hybrid sensor histidine kinase/response regulator [Pseudorhodoplanes sinuspersici]|uniref:histidine kinase n=1 Tax=Pseudorhodoplanes sinuspersici TaxID=1235591 RepID=A0A1W6ZZG8_9HYPH|nr:PAS domain-containing hybrid sensor histidine kinase/response regulator [Pseudorhodoplanes sinuspersici]ARQ02769.1 hybrid sensor histidine kinase/response regulator [Pseudorhodoplanes sinuspersici]
MLEAWIVVAIALAYIGFLFVVASYGDRRWRLARRDRSRLLIYPLCLAIYCTSWTFFGSVGLASKAGFDFLTIYIGPILMIGLFTPLVLRIVRLAKSQNITSIADFIAARYGKRQSVAALVALIAIIGTIPYIALQLKAVSSMFGTVFLHVAPGFTPNAVGDTALLVALAMAAFAILFGTRHIDATEHQDGLMLAIATESIVKLAAFLAVGLFVTYVMFDGPADLFSRALSRPDTAAVLTTPPTFSTVIAMTLLSFVAIILLPRQFHVTVVENHSEAEVKRAAWLFPLYLVLINLFVIPIALAGLLTFPSSGADSDMFVLALPLSVNASFFTIAAFIGGLSAATAMVIVESVALAIMVSNDLVVPIFLKRRSALVTGQADVGALLLRIRRIAIFAILLLAYLYYHSVGDAQLAAIGLLSFAAAAQLAPAFFGGLFWRQGTARGAIAGLTVGILAWAYTLLIPSAAGSGLVSPSVLTDGPFGLWFLRPQALFGLDLPQLAHGVFWSLALNIIAYVGFSLSRAPEAIERVQADVFVPDSAPAPSFRLWRSAVTVDELTATVSRYIGEERTRSSFESFAAAKRIDTTPGSPADFQLLQHAEHLLASAIGAASSRLVLSLLLRKRTVSTRAALKLLDDANAAIHYNREILQTALEHVSEGIAVFDKEFQLVCWNRQFGEVLDLPRDMIGIGTRLEEILRLHAERGVFGRGDIDELVAERMARYVAAEPFIERFSERGLVLDVRTNHMPGGGIVTTFTDVTPSFEAAEALERRVAERTTELTLLNGELVRAKADAEEANISKTRFLAAASHDILQPLNAARLYVTSLVERQGSGEDGRLVGNIDASLDAVEEILGALLDISRLDTGAMKPEVGSFRLDEMMRQLEVEFAPLAREKGLDLTFVLSSATVRSDRRLLRRLLQNLISNAIKYTPRGRVLVGCRRTHGALRIEVHDSGLGIPPSQTRAIFREFHRLQDGAKVARGLGLGLSIVERIGRVLNHSVELKSRPGRGSMFSVEVPVAAAVRASVLQRPVRAIPAQLGGMAVLCIDNDPQILDGMEALLSGWGCQVMKAPNLSAAIAVIETSDSVLSGLLVDYHLDDGNGIDVIVRLRERFGRTMPSILITADRTPRVRDEARRHDVPILNKPVKPAALRALLAQWRMQTIAAE